VPQPQESEPDVLQEAS
jgi:hypothetical protein